MKETIYPNHDPHCIIYELGPEHCNCVQYDPNYEPEETYPTDVAAGGSFINSLTIDYASGANAIQSNGIKVTYNPES